jgi:light-regulated signal transduction histidine kinase (bacteriophytochrome)
MEQPPETYHWNIFRQTLAMLQCVKCSFSDFRHDMANSVNALNMTVEYLNEFFDVDGDQDTAELIEASKEQLKEMKKALIPLQQYDSPAPFSMRDVAIAPLINGILTEVQEELKEAIELSWKIAPDVNTVFTNRDALIQAILIQLIHTVGILLGCENARIDVSVERKDSRIECIFADNRTTTVCSGNVPERSELFSMQQDTLELYMCREILSRLNGSLTIAQAGTTGKVITLTLPEREYNES